MSPAILSLILLVLGIVLIAVEVTVIPGFGLTQPSRRHDVFVSIRRE